MADVQAVYLIIEGTVSTTAASIEGEVSTIAECLFGELTLPTDMPYYVGEYEINPDFVGTSLQTTGKVLTQNVTVHPIQVENVSNPQGGRTVYIGGII